MTTLRRDGLDMDDETPLSGAETGPEPGLVRYLKWLVTALSVTMIGGVIVLVAVVVMRFNAETAPTWPAEIVLPEGARPAAVTRGPDWIAVVTEDGRILIFAADGRDLRQEIVVAPAP